MKNISQPVRAFRVRIDDPASEEPVASPFPAPSGSWIWLRAGRMSQNRSALLGEEGSEDNDPPVGCAEAP